MVKKRKSSLSAKGLTFKKGRELVIRVKTLEGKSADTIRGYEKVFNDFERCFGVSKPMTNVSLDDARQFIDWQLNEKTQYLKAQSRTNKKIGVSIASVNLTHVIALTIYT